MIFEMLPRSLAATTARARGYAQIERRAERALAAFG
jgi:hypothetical protein